tara:strand:- start:693 stop:821 length:129 start_codon:yes stop_codon:yes gene_type:complete
MVVCENATIVPNKKKAISTMPGWVNGFVDHVEFEVMPMYSVD